MIPGNTLSAIAVCLVGSLVVLGAASRSRSEVIGVYDKQKLVSERPRLETRTKELWQKMYENLLSPEEKGALKNSRLQFPWISSDGEALNFISNSRQQTVDLPIHSLLLLEDACTAYAWLHHNGYSPVTINEYASVLKYRRLNDPGAEIPPPLKALGIPDDALTDPEVSQLSLRFRNSAYAFVIGHEMGHILHRHPGNRAVAPHVSKAHEREADKFALKVLKEDHQIPIGAILFFQMTAFIASPGRFDSPTEKEWQKALQQATHPLTSDRVRGVAELLHTKAGDYRENREIALDVAEKLEQIAKEMDDHDWQLYFKKIGEEAPIKYLLPRKK